MAMRAVMRGRKAAKSAPNASPSTMSANTTPSSVLFDPGWDSAFSMSWPPSATCSCWSLSRLRGRDDPLHRLLGQALGLLVEGDRGERHGAVLADLGRAGGREGTGHRAHVGQRRPPRAACAALRPLPTGPRRLPEVAWKTIWSVLPETAGNSFSSRFRAVNDWVFGSWNLVEKALPRPGRRRRTPPEPPARAMRTILRWRKHHRPRASRAHRLVEGGPRCIVEYEFATGQVLLQVRQRGRPRDEQHRGRLGQQPGQRHLGGGRAQACWRVCSTAGADSTGFSGHEGRTEGKERHERHAVCAAGVEERLVDAVRHVVGVLDARHIGSSTRPCGTRRE